MVLRRSSERMSLHEALLLVLSTLRAPVQLGVGSGSRIQLDWAHSMLEAERMYLEQCFVSMLLNHKVFKSIEELVIRKNINKG
jgi:hypothetical protein